jgi:hypothetical protein
MAVLHEGRSQMPADRPSDDPDEAPQPDPGEAAAEGAAPWQPGASPYLDFGYAAPGRLIAWVCLGAVLALLVWLLALPSDEAAPDWLSTVLMVAVGTALSYGLLRTATGRVVVDRAGVHLVDRGTVESVGWDDIHRVQATGEGSYPRLLVGSLEIDDFAAPGRTRRRLAETVRTCVADPAVRPTGVAELRPFPLLWVCGGIALALAALAVWGQR